MNRNLSRLLAQFGLSEQPDIGFNDLQLDSRKINSGDIFVAISGHQVDGRTYIDKAIENGAVAVILDVDDEQQHGQIVEAKSVPVIGFNRLAAQLSSLAEKAYFSNGNPLTVIGVTGTNGKSTVTHLIANLANLNGTKAAVMGTLGNGVPGELIVSENTTADAITVQRQLAELAEQGVELVAMEISSHGLVQGRVASVPFNTAVFTNLSRDHLDYHGSMLEYGRAKQMLFNWPSLKHRLINIDDAFGQQLLAQYATAQSYSLNDPEADYMASQLNFSSQGASGQFNIPCIQATPLEWQSPLLGKFNVENLLCALAVLIQQGMDVTELLSHLQQLTAVPGRMELFHRRHYSVVVDYAHTPDALEKALAAMKHHCQGKVFCIFGCGGDRDKGKRPLMAATAEQFSDVLVITDDNPRNEDPKAIVADMLEGLQQPEQAQVIHSRHAALSYALTQVQPGDMILVAGKGHETYQIIGNQSLDYDERQVVCNLLEEQ